MPIAGMAAGAARGLEEIVAQRILEQKLQQEIANRERQDAMEQARLNETMRNNDFDRKRTEKIDAANEADREEKRSTAKLMQRGRSNMAQVVAMGVDPETAKREIAFSALNSGSDVPGGVMEAITPPKVQKYAVTTPGPNGKPTRRLATEQELAEGVEEYREPRAPQRPERDPIADHEAKLKLDAKYKQPGAANPVAEAQDTAREAKRIADALASHPGVKGAFGVLDARLPTLNQSTADAEVLRDSLTSLLTLENMGKMKGVLSDSDMKVLRQASSTIAAPMSDAAAVAELKRISEVMSRATGEGLPTMDMATSRGGPANTGASDRAAELIKKYGGGR